MRIFALLLSIAIFFALSGCAGSPINEGVSSDGRPYRGSASPKLVIYEYSDFECPFCSKALPAIDDVLRAYPDDVQLQFRHFPLPIHPRANPSAVAAVCAEGQGKFWQMHDKLFANQQALEDADLKRYAGELGLDAAAFNSCIASQQAQDAVDKDKAEGEALGVGGTPSFKVGETVVIGSAKLRQVVESELARLR